MTFLRDRTVQGMTIALGVMLIVSALVPSWIVNQLLFGCARAIAVLGLMVLWRTRLVSFGHALYFGLGAYTVAMLARYTGVTDAFLLIGAAAGVSTIIGFFIGFIVRRYRDIFFAMLNLAFSMILYGILVKSETLGSTDGFTIEQPTFAGIAFEDATEGKLALLCVLLVVGWAVAIGVQAYLRSTLGRLTTAIGDNEIRVEYLGYSAEHAIHIKYVLSTFLAGIGGGFMALALGQVDPDSMVNWTASGELVFVTILSGPGSVAAPFIGSFVFELLRTYAFEWMPHAWQMIVGGTLLVVIFFMPGGLWSLVARIAGRLTGKRAAAAAGAPRTEG
ncbi:MAG: branched-chain amino acid ABC transporter permease [bacterium]|jgi:ABC-type branched-subunit amino acid transport system permease subunit